MAGEAEKKQPQKLQGEPIGAGTGSQPEAKVTYHVVSLFVGMIGFGRIQGSAARLFSRLLFWSFR